MLKFSNAQVEPIWVKDPHSGNDINVAPLFFHLHELEDKPNLPLAAGARITIERVLKVLNLTVHDPIITEPADLANLYQDLHRLKDMFEALEIKPQADI